MLLFGGSDPLFRDGGGSEAGGERAADAYAGHVGLVNAHGCNKSC